MSLIATVTLGSGCFLPREEKDEPFSTEIGYFQSTHADPEIKVSIDGVEVRSSDLKLGTDCVIEVRHKDAKGNIRKDGVKSTADFHKKLLHMWQLYGEHETCAGRDRFDCILRFYSGRFRAEEVKDRTFREYWKETDSSPLTHQVGNGTKVVRAIAHDVAIDFELQDGDTLELARNDYPFWSSSGATSSVDIKIIADDSMVEKFFCNALCNDRMSYWLPNSPDDPPPSCSKPPCNGAAEPE